MLVGTGRASQQTPYLTGVAMEETLNWQLRDYEQGRRLPRIPQELA